MYPPALLDVKVCLCVFQHVVNMFTSYLYALSGLRLIHSECECFVSVNGLVFN